MSQNDAKRSLPRVANGAIAVPFDRKPQPHELEDLRAQGADIFELRLDMAGNPDPDEAAQISESFAGFPLIVTCRSAQEGGHGDDDTNRLLRLAACATNATALDIELAAVDILPKACMVAEANGCEMLVSFHDTQGTPDLEHLQDIVERCFDAGAGIAKVATTANTEDDIVTLLKLLDFALAKNIPLAVMGMGKNDLAIRSRARLGRAGSVFVFAQGNISSAKGQPQLASLAKHLRGDSA